MMDLENKFLDKEPFLQCTKHPRENGYSRSLELLQESLKSDLKKQLLQSCVDKNKTRCASSKHKMSEVQKTSSSTLKNPPSKKQSRKGDNPVRFLPPEHSPEYRSSDSWICKNSACRASLSIDDTFCRRCSCCICHSYDDNKDPSLWLICSSVSGNIDSCGLSCHIECALREKKVGVVDLGQMMQLDGSYCCASCGKVSGILGCWKKQLAIAKDARRVDVLCYRIFLSYKLLEGTSRFKELIDIVNDAREKLETEVGLLCDSANLARGIVSRLSVAGDVMKLCSQAIEKADEWLANVFDVNLNCRDSLPASCRFLFEEVRSSSVVIILIETPSVPSDDIKGYKLWYCKNKEETHPKEPICVFPRTQRRITVSNLQPCTEYKFRIVSYTMDGDLGHSEVKCFTKSLEIVHKNFDSAAPKNHKKASPLRKCPSGFKVRDLGNVLPQEHPKKEGPVSRELDLNVASVPDLNEELTPPFDSSGDEDLAHAMEADDDAASRGIAKNEPIRSHGSDSTLINGSPFQLSDGSGGLNESFEYCVKIIRWLECEGHIDKEFRLKLLTWFSLRSTDQERRVVNTFIQTLIDDPSSLAGQLVDSFSEVISSKRQRNGVCSVFC